MSTSDPGKPKKKRGRIALGAAGGTLILLGGAYVAGYAFTGDTLPRNATVEGVAVGGLTPADAAAKLQSELGERAGAPMTLTASDQAVTKTPAELGLSVDWQASADRAGAGKSWNPLIIWDNLLGGSEHQALVVRDDVTLVGVVAELAGVADAEPTSATLAFDQLEPVVTESVPGTRVDRTATADAAAEAYLHATEVAAVTTSVEPDITTDEARQTQEEVARVAVSAPVALSVGGKTADITPAMIASALSFNAENGVLVPALDGEKLQDEASATFKELGLTQPKNARFTFANGKPTIVASENGMGISAEDLVAVVQPALAKTEGRVGEASATPLEADFTTEEAQNAGVKEVTGSFTTYYPGSAYRVNNIGKAARLVNGTYLAPGQTFSMNKVLGYRSVANGWMEGGAIDGGQVVTRMGGGISQATTTTFNAMFFAGLEDIYHKPHSLYFSRYPMGREATLDWHSVDLKFRNDSPYGVLLQAWTTGGVGQEGSITVRVWSTKVYDVKASNPVQSNFRSPGPAKVSTAADCVAQSPMTGFDVRYNRLFYQGGKLVRTEPFFWRYNTLTPVTCA